MDPNVSSWLTHSQYTRKHDDLERESVAYRPPVEHVWPRLARSTRRRLAILFLTIGARLGEQPAVGDIAPEVDPAPRTP